MIFPSLETLPSWSAVLATGAHFAGGIGLGQLAFRSLWHSVRQFTAGGSAKRIAALMCGRLVLLGAVLLAVSLEGALPLLTTTLGLLLGRSMVLRRVREAAP